LQPAGKREEGREDVWFDFWKIEGGKAMRIRKKMKSFFFLFYWW